MDSIHLYLRYLLQPQRDPNECSTNGPEHGFSDEVIYFNIEGEVVMK